MSGIKKKLKLQPSKKQGIAKTNLKEIALLEKKLLTEQLSEEIKVLINEQIVELQSQINKLKIAHKVVNEMDASHKKEMDKYRNKGNAVFISGGGTGLKR